MILACDDAESAPTEPVRFVRSDVAIMVTSGAVVLAGHSAGGPDRKSVQTFVLIKNGHHWRVAAFHNTRKQGHAA